MPSVTSNQIKTLLHLVNTVRYADDAQHAMHRFQEIQQACVRGVPKSPEEYVRYVFLRTEVYNSTVEARHRIRTLATGYCVSFPRDSDVNRAEEVIVEQATLRIIAWDGLAFYTWHRFTNPITKKTTSHLHLVASTVADGLTPTLRRTRMENVLMRLRRVMDVCLININAQRASQGKELIPSIEEVQARRGYRPLEQMIAQEARLQGLSSLTLAKLPTVLRAIGLVEFIDWEIDFRLRLRFRPPPKVKQLVKSAPLRDLSIPIFDLLRSINTLLIKYMSQEKEQQKIESIIKNETCRKEKDTNDQKHNERSPS